MELGDFKVLVDLLPKSRATAEPIAVIASRLPRGSKRTNRRWLYRQLESLYQSEGEGTKQNIIKELVRYEYRLNDRTERYAMHFYLDVQRLNALFMTDSVQLNLQVAQGALSPALREDPAFAIGQLAEMADQSLRKKPGAHSLARHVRIVPDNVYRLPADIAPAVLGPIIQALQKKRKLDFTYRSRAGRESTKSIEPCGLIIKDASIYVVGLEGGRPEPSASYAVHRMVRARVSAQNAVRSNDFNLDAWLEKTGNLSHPKDVDQEFTLELRVHNDAKFHFRERPLGPDQRLERDPENPDWWLLRVKAKHWHALCAFLVSFGPNVEVLAPTYVRAEVADWVARMANHYAVAKGSDNSSELDGGSS